LNTALLKKDKSMAIAYTDIIEVLNLYFDGLHHSDTARLKRAFHPQASYVCAVEQPLLQLGMVDYFAIVDKRPSPASLGEVRQDRIISIEMAGPVTAFARLECAIGPKRFIDFLTLIHVEQRWQIISKVFHYDLIDQAN
jgi:Putative lumazine-binding